ncbi:MAG: type II toxin-antitoxin system VapC family toxin [Terriglobales bacterium]
MILLDTNALIWLALEPGKLSKNAATAIREAVATVGLAISSMTIWEAAWLANAGRLQFSGTVDTFVSEIARRCRVIEITPEIAVASVRLPSPYPRDPVDRLIGATALVHALPLVTKDAAIRRTAGIRTIW